MTYWDCEIIRSLRKKCLCSAYDLIFFSSVVCEHGTGSCVLSHIFWEMGEEGQGLKRMFCVQRLLDGFYISETADGFLDIKQIAWKKGS